MQTALSLPDEAPAPRQREWAIQLVGVEKSYGLLRKHAALSGVTLQIERGRCYGLAGPNGAGKTTLIKVMLGLIVPDAGEVRLLGHHADSPEIRRKIGFVPEAADLPPGATPMELVARWATLRGLPKREALRDGERHLLRLGMQELLKRPAHRFSKGERQRTLLSLALLGSPDLLVLDEPTDGLDPLGRALMRRVIQEECAEGRTVFLNSHLLSETERLCHRVGILHRGRLVRELELDPESEPRRERGTSTITLHEPLSEEEAKAFDLRPTATPASYVVEHDDIKSLNATIDSVRARGSMLVDLRRVQTSIEDTLALVASGVATSTEPTEEAVLDEPVPLPVPPARSVRAVARVARELVSDLIARKIAWVALAGVLVLFGIAFAFVRNQVVIGAVETVNQFGDGQLFSKKNATAMLGGGIGQGLSGVLLFTSTFLAALFAPPVLATRRNMLLLAQPVSRSDVATGIFVSVCGFTLALFTLAFGLLFASMHWLHLPLSPRFLLIPLVTALSFASIYAGTLCVTHLFPNGLFAGIFGLGQLLLFVFLGETTWANPATSSGLSSFLMGLPPKIVPLANQALRLGRGEPPQPFPIVTTALYVVAMVLLLQVLARRSER